MTSWDKDSVTVANAPGIERTGLAGAFDNLEKEVCALGEIVEHLSGKLQYVMSEPISPINVPERAPNPMSPARGRIISETENIRAIRLKLEEVNKSLDL
jgi:hypothetical protein